MKRAIIDAYCRIRTIDQTIPDDVLDFMKNSAIEKLDTEPTEAVDYGKIVTDHLGNDAPTDWDQNSNYRITLYDAKVLMQAAIEQDRKGRERFKMPTGRQLVEAAIIFNDGKIEREKLADMIAVCDFLLHRLYENGDAMIPAQIEKTN